jgi:hypothetical protein
MHLVTPQMEPQKKTLSELAFVKVRFTMLKAATITKTVKWQVH